MSSASARTARRLSPRRLLVARLWFEGNRFAPGLTDLAAFQRVEWAHGDAALAAARGTEHELAAVADFAAARSDWQVSVSRCAAAWPGGPIDDALFEAFADEVQDDVRRVQPHALYLSLHGAAITQGLQAPEMALLRRLRAALGPRPLVASFDLHANLDPGITALLDFASAYRTYPHVDLRATAHRVLARLDDLCNPALPAPTGCIGKLGSLLPSFCMRTEFAPMAPLLAIARALEAAHPGTDISILGGFPYADTVHADAGVMVWSDRAANARAIAAAMLDRLRERQHEFDVTLPSPAEGLAQALSRMRAEAAKPTPMIVALTDPADNPLSGGGADTPTLLRELLAMHDRLPPRESDSSLVFAYFCDPALVQRAIAAGPGAELDVALGGRLGPAFGPPVACRARVLRLSDGPFVNTGPMQRGQKVDAGPGAVLQVMGVSVILCSAVVPANDPAFFARHGIRLEDTRLLCVKAKNHFHAAFAARCAAIIEVDCPGPAMADLSRLPWRHWPWPSPPALRA
ncbi:MAG: M81 family metallopeptidase [Rubrivivax sp.]